MMKAAVNEDWGARKIVFIVVVYVLLILSLVDVYFFECPTNHTKAFKYMCCGVKERISSFSSIDEDDQF